MAEFTEETALSQFRSTGPSLDIGIKHSRINTSGFLAWKSDHCRGLRLIVSRVWSVRENPLQEISYVVMHDDRGITCGQVTWQSLLRRSP